MTTATSDYPALIVEWRPSVGPATDSGTWVDITDDVAQGSTDRGRQYEIDQFQAGTCTLTLRTADRKYDPENRASTYYPNIVPMRQIRISATWNTVNYPIFYGYITDWGQTTPSDKLYETTITAKDGFARLEQIKLPSSAWALEVQRDDPSLWFRLGETDTVRATDSSDGGNYGLYDNVTQGSTGLVVNDSDGAVEIGTADERVFIQNPALISGYPFTVELMLKNDGMFPDAFRVAFAGIVDESDANPGFEIAVNDSAPESDGLTYSGKVRSKFRNSVNRTVSSTTVVTDNFPHHVAVVYESASSHLIYVDGAVDSHVIDNNNPAWFSSNPRLYTLGNYSDVLFGSFSFLGIIDECVVWNGRALAASDVARHSLAALNGWDSDDTGSRVDRFLDAIDWPSTLRDISTGISILGPASWSTGATALSVLQAWADTEYGQFFMGKDGMLVWRSRHYPYLDTNSTTSQATFGDGHSSATLQFDLDGIDLPQDEALIRNPVQASRAGGVTVTAKDQTYIDKYGDRTWAAPPTEDQKDSVVRDRAIYFRDRFKELGTRLASITFTPRKDPTNLWPAMLGLEIGDRVTVKRTPLGLNEEINKDFIIEGIHHDFAPMRWTTTFRGSPVDPNVGSYLILDDPVYGLMS